MNTLLMGGAVKSEQNGCVKTPRTYSLSSHILQAVIFVSQTCLILRETRCKNTKQSKRSCISFLITLTFYLTSVQVILVSYCLLLCVFSNDMLNVSIGTFF